LHWSQEFDSPEMVWDTSTLTLVQADEISEGSFRNAMQNKHQ
jgi:hypothetical protein